MQAMRLAPNPVLPAKTPDNPQPNKRRIDRWHAHNADVATYCYDEGDDMPGGDERLERCAACGHIFDTEDSEPEDDASDPARRQKPPPRAANLLARGAHRLVREGNETSGQGKAWRWCLAKTARLLRRKPDAD